MNAPRLSPKPRFLSSIEIVSIWLVVYLSISIVTSLFMNWFNARMALVER